ncbi:hypothetical protein G6O67_007220 [Ophiocordyceps sinensis]|uniref:Uncharacterized protein n=2 Tax=Ophiocordyceps sinensis TaxID=72228 RepID=A0A8H4PKP8_9HYPO|nr:major facilitator superfamily transporter [Ophiocordyceps sinensis CO18]KAF4505253.1 hypothetical protein G6O67_007220 [Ophiocordyceps sinensis]
MASACSSAPWPSDARLAQTSPSRFLSGCVGITPAALLGASTGDLMPPESMGKAMSAGRWFLDSAGEGETQLPTIAPFPQLVAPIAGGYLSQQAGWRCILWLLAILMAVAIPALFLLWETYAPIILARKAKQLRRLAMSASLDSSHTTPQQAIGAALFLFTSPVLFLLS